MKKEPSVHAHIFTPRWILCMLICMLCVCLELPNYCTASQGSHWVQPLNNSHFNLSLVTFLLFKLLLLTLFTHSRIECSMTLLWLSHFVDCRAQITQGRKVLSTLDSLSKLVERVWVICSTGSFVLSTVYSAIDSHISLHCVRVVLPHPFILSKSKNNS